MAGRALDKVAATTLAQDFLSERFLSKRFLSERFVEAFCRRVSEHMTCTGGRRETLATFAVPSVAMFIMVGWDVCLDPSAARHRSQHAV
jgi:hypothetical protein